MRRILVALVFVLAAAAGAHAQSGRTFYIDYCSGSDTNLGTARTDEGARHVFGQNFNSNGNTFATVIVANVTCPSSPPVSLSFRSIHSSDDGLIWQEK